MGLGEGVNLKAHHRRGHCPGPRGSGPQPRMPARLLSHLINTTNRLRARAGAGWWSRPACMRQVMADLVLSDKTFHRLGPAVNSNASISLYGPPGNGKTSIASSIGDMILHEPIYIPYALYIDGQVVKLYDSVNHKVVPEEDSPRPEQVRCARLAKGPTLDKNRATIRRGRR